jgi:hypothetical protein
MMRPAEKIGISVELCGLYMEDLMDFNNRMASLKSFIVSQAAVCIHISIWFQESYF